SRGAPLAPANLRALRAYAQRLASLPGVTGVLSPFDALDPDAMTPQQLAASAASEPTASKLRRLADGHGALFFVQQPNPWRSDGSADLLQAVRATPQGELTALAGGPTAQMVDMVAALRSFGVVAAALVAG